MAAGPGAPAAGLAAAFFGSTAGPGAAPAPSWRREPGRGLLLSRGWGWSSRLLGLSSGLGCRLLWLRGRRCSYIC